MNINFAYLQAEEADADSIMSRFSCYRHEFTKHELMNWVVDRAEDGEKITVSGLIVGKIGLEAPDLMIDGARVLIENLGEKLYKTEEQSSVYRALNFFRFKKILLLDGREIRYRLDGEENSFHLWKKDQNPYFDYMSCNGTPKGKINLWKGVAQDIREKRCQLLLIGGDMVYSDEKDGKAPSIFELPIIKEWVEWIKSKRSADEIQKYEEGMKAREKEIKDMLRDFFARLYLSCYLDIKDVARSCLAIMQLDDHELYDGARKTNLWLAELIRAIGIEAYLLFQHHVTQDELTRANGFLDDTSGKIYRLSQKKALVAFDMRMKREDGLMISNGAFTQAYDCLLSNVKELETVDIMIVIPIVFPSFPLWLAGCLTDEQNPIDGTTELQDDMKDGWKYDSDSLKRLFDMVKLLTIVNPSVKFRFYAGDVHVGCMSKIVLPPSLTFDREIGIEEVASSGIGSEAPFSPWENYAFTVWQELKNCIHPFACCDCSECTCFCCDHGPSCCSSHMNFLRAENAKGVFITQQNYFSSARNGFVTSNEVYKVNFDDRSCLQCVRDVFGCCGLICDSCGSGNAVEDKEPISNPLPYAMA
ncbi:MAG: hypothetical protein H6850_04120 [Alphaproteobacteria bacterium]|nr:MAG: hypothetical protein H6850_04120 [Alphaproteobacteria bacterium]